MLIMTLPFLVFAFILRDEVKQTKGGRLCKVITPQSLKPSLRNVSNLSVGVVWYCVVSQAYRVHLSHKELYSLSRVSVNRYLGDSS